MSTKVEIVIDTKDVVAVLNELTETCLDGQKGYAAAAEKAKEASLKVLFARYAAQRATYATELKAATASLGEEYSKTGHVAATIHRGWISVKEALSNDGDTTLINECEAGEDAAMKAYKEALQKVLPPVIETLVKHQFGGVSEAHNNMRDLKHSRQ